MIKYGFQLNFLRKKKDYNSALKYYINVVDFFPKEKEADAALVRMAEVYEENRDYKNALLYLDKALNNSITNADEIALFNKARIYYAANSFREALGYFREFLSRFPASILSKQAAEWVDIIAKEMKN